MDFNLPVSGFCLNPQRIFNSYTQEYLTVPCGKCAGCVMHKNSRLAFQCDLESYSHEYCLFVTLTYANRFIPRAIFVDAIDRPFGCDLYDKETGEFLGECDLLEEQRDELLKKFHLFGDIPYLRKYDLQLFLKRLRYYVSRYTTSKVRYFACGEYGPVHFRPHYHLLLFFDDPKILEVSSEVISKSWTNGIVDSSLSRGQCSSYCASYVNSSVPLPKVFKMSSTRPFSIHSQRLGQGFLFREREKVYSSSTREFINRSISIDGKYKEFSLWRSCYSFYFPKCKGFACKSTRQLVESYTIYRTAREIYVGCDTCADLAREIASTISVIGCPLVSSELDSDFTIVGKHRSLLRYFYDSASSCKLDSSEYNAYVNRIYTELLVSKHFLTFVCDQDVVNYPTSREVLLKVKRIQEFYKQLDYMHLYDFFQKQSLYFEDDLIGDEHFLLDDYDNCFCPYFYDNVAFDNKLYKMQYPYKLFEAHIYEQSQNRIKHKQLNDLNKIFLYE